MFIINKIFSIKKTRTHKIITILGFKIKNRRDLSSKKMISYIEQLKFILDSCCDITQCKPATGALRKFQLTKAKIFKEFLRIMEIHKIDYWLDGGTLLGAIRHKGYIPWDDDLDIAMDRDNYNKLVNLLKTDLKNTPFSYAIGTKRTGFYAKIFFNDFDILDIFIYDFSNNPASQQELYALWKESRKLFYEKYPKKDLWAGLINFEDIYEDMHEFYKQGNLVLENNSQITWLFKGFDSATKNITCNIFRANAVYPLKRTKFEDFEAYIPNNSHEYLSTVNSGHYGDFMSFPPLSADHVFTPELYEETMNFEYLEKIEEEFEKMLKDK